MKMDQEMFPVMMIQENVPVRLSFLEINVIFVPKDTMVSHIALVFFEIRKLLHGLSLY